MRWFQIALPLTLTLSTLACERDHSFDPTQEESLPVIPVERLDVPVRLLSLPRIVYPDIARIQEHEGTVHILVIVNSDGSAGAAEVAQSSGYEELDAAAYDAALGARFTRPSLDGVPVRTQVILPCRFTLDLNPTPALPALAG